ncbi:MAG: ABC transporter substrate-binding protein [Treponema sp.]|jgi:iron complex transport system substrate-binding protein|nr:ABC transporter substrate-binding protein [Treponema sp.]
MQKRSVVIRILGAVLLIGCTQKSNQATVTAGIGKEAAIPARIDRIISTAPSNTEIIVDLGLGEKLVAVDTYSAGIPGIPEEVMAIDFTYPDGETIVGLEPDLIISAGHNITGSGEDPFKVLRESGILVFSIPTSGSIAEIYEDIAFIARLLSVPEKGDALVSDMRRQIETIAALGSGITDKRTVYFEISPAPFLVTMGRNTFLHEMIAIIGAENSFGNETGWISPSVEAILDKNPDVILSNVSYVDNPIAEIQNRDGFSTLQAVRTNRIYLIDSNASSRPSHRIVLALQQMAHAVYPEVYEKR